jgi:2-polyprenyl-6-methoxyphenol hydroxylase-like FAD-dependent oxidoreductase
MSTPRDLPVAVIGAGPVGLAAASHLIARGLPVKLYEAGDGRCLPCPQLGSCAPVLAVALQ